MVRKTTSGAVATIFALGVIALAPGLARAADLDESYSSDRYYPAPPPEDDFPPPPVYRRSPPPSEDVYSPPLPPRDIPRRGYEPPPRHYSGEPGYDSPPYGERCVVKRQWMETPYGPQRIPRRVCW